MRAMIAAITLGLALAACSMGSDGTATGTPAPTETTADGENAVRIKGFLYGPANIDISAGATVTWTNDDEILHTVTSGTPDKPETAFDGQLTSKSETFSQAFKRAGTYPYFCTRHNHMQGTVTVT